MEKRILKVIFNTSGSGSKTTRLTLPKTWIDKLQVSEDERELEVAFDEEKGEIILKKHQK